MDRRHQWACYCNSDHGKQTKVMLMSVYFPHTGYADHHVEKACKSIEKYTKSSKHIQIVAADFNAELGAGCGIGRLCVGPYTLKESNKGGDWMKH